MYLQIMYVFIYKYIIIVLKVYQIDLYYQFIEHNIKIFFYLITLFVS